MLTEAQEALTDFLFSIKMETTRVLYIMALLQEEAATREMIHYIVQTKESDFQKLLETALKISSNYPEPEDMNYDNE